MSPRAVVLNIAIIVGIVGIIVYWIRRFAVFLGYKAIREGVEQIAALLKTRAIREGSDVVVEGYLGWLPTTVRFSHKVDTPGLDIRMSVPATFNLAVTPKSATLTGEGRVLMRTGSAQLDRRFNARTDQPVEARIFLSDRQTLAILEQLCCSSQTGLVIEDRLIQLSELTIPPFTANHVLDHLYGMSTMAKRMLDMPGAAQIKVRPLPQRGSTWTIRASLLFGLVALLALLFAQPYNLPVAPGTTKSVVRDSGVFPADAALLQKLGGWHVAKPDDFPESAAFYLRQHGLHLSGHILGDFAGSGKYADSAYLLVDGQGHRRVAMMAGGRVVYDAIFPSADFIARIPKGSLGKIEWSTAPQFDADGDALLVVQHADDPAASLVLLRHGAQTYSARPADFSQINLGLQ